MPARVVLNVLSGPIRGQAFAFDGHETFLVGRGADCHARLPNDGLISRHHFLLEVNPPDARVRDLGSRNGTLVNDVLYGGRDPRESPETSAGRAYPVVDLVEGDRLTVGNTSIQVRVLWHENCCQCESEISGPDLALAQHGDQVWMCAACRGAQATVQPPATPPVAPCCQNCRKDVSSELTAGRSGDYVCAACRAALSSAGGGLLRLVRQAATPVHCSGLDLEDYELGDELGRGGMGVVYAARRKADGRLVAVKIMLAKVAVDSRARLRFEREIALTAQLRHRNVVQILESGVAGSVFFAVMEHCQHGSLHTLIRQQGGKLSLPIAIGLMRDCLAGLSHAHEPPSSGQPRLVHRDLKPHNILLAEQEGSQVAKIADFGLAKSFEMAGLSGMTATGAVGGTCHFMPREQLTNYKYVQPASDVWSLAATFYYMLTGHVPLDFPAHRDMVEVILRDEPVPIRRRDKTLPGALAEVLDRALETDLSARYATAGEMKVALEQALGT